MEDHLGVNLPKQHLIGRRHGGVDLRHLGQDEPRLLAQAFAVGLAPGICAPIVVWQVAQKRSTEVQEHAAAGARR